MAQAQPNLQPKLPVQGAGEKPAERAPATHRPAPSRRRRKSVGSMSDRSVSDLVSLSFDAQKGISKASAAHLFERVAATSALPTGKLRAELIPDSSWKRAGKTLGHQASQTAARLDTILAFATRVWGNENDAIQWLINTHPELRGATPFSLLRTEAGGRAVEAILAALEYGFPV
jgi:putative toxin-antitoxin system antitoxin component (TIGR02293 family)